MRTPWGKSEIKEAIAVGIVTVSTATHGGIHLAPDRNAIVPEYMRIGNGWYEEDCDWCIPALVFADEFESWCFHSSRDPATMAELAKSSLRHWHPEAYEKFFDSKETTDENSVSSG